MKGENHGSILENTLNLAREEHRKVGLALLKVNRILQLFFEEYRLEVLALFRLITCD